eukprot:c1323_g1_i1.p1 GENE.c1323_g1_i1~~c1323_g1_i1.p1  ORF type:complete len:247 (-),score=67.16 c1323_g1_i1:115-855(-)
MITYLFTALAGHCVDSRSSCDDTRLVFNYFYESSGVMATVNEDDVYSCIDYIRGFSTAESGAKIDYAIVKLDREVSGAHTPVVVSNNASDVHLNEFYDIIGFPSGLPAKILSNFPLRSVSPELGYFMGSPDTFGGNSGSGVFDSKGSQVGILVEGYTDYTPSNSGDCNLVEQCSQNDCGGELMTYASVAFKALSNNECSVDQDCSRAQCNNGYCFESVPQDGGGSAALVSLNAFLATVALVTAVVM